MPDPICALDGCDRLGWTVKAANRAPYADLDEPAKELDRATVRAVLAAVLPQHDARLLEEVADEITVHPGPDPSPASPAWWAGYAEAIRDAAAIARNHAEGGDNVSASPQTMSNLLGDDHA